MSFAMGLDQKRPGAWEQYGWPKDVTFELMYQAYERTGAGQGAVHRLLDGCWEQLPRIKRPEDDAKSDWENNVDALFKSIKLWAKLKEFDRRQMVGRYGGLIYRVADGKTLDQPLERATKLVDVLPVFESQLKVTRWHSDINDAENYGKPAMFQYRKRTLADSSDKQCQPDEWADVHPSRVQIFAEGAVGDDFMSGIPLLRAGFNDLVDMEKIGGGSAESFLKNSARTIIFKYDANASPQAMVDDMTGQKVSVRELHERRTRALNTNQDSSIVMQGGEASTLQTTIADPKPSFEVAANKFAASIRLPFTVIFGQQTGRLASDEDRKDANARYKGRQEYELTPMIEEFVTRMQKAGLIDDGPFEVEWPPLGAPSDEQKFGNLDKLTSAMQKASLAGLAEPIFDTNELRKVAGYEERTQIPGLPVEGDGAGVVDGSTAP